MDKIMYIQNVPWSWIKQRPHFIAEGLAEYFNVDVYSKKAYNANNITCNKTNKVNIYELFRLPFERFFIIEKISNFIVAYQLKKKIKKYDIIWITDPRTYIFIKKVIDQKQIIIFDCMDDYAEFSMINSREYILKNYLKSEKILLNDSNIIFFSSQYLLETVIKRHGLQKKTKYKIINNAIKEQLVTCDKIITAFDETKKYKVVTYIGTISSWMDFDLILESLKINKNIVYHFYGPKDVDIPKNDRIFYKGILEHEEIVGAMNAADMLVMPFLPIKLVLSVDPVKLYEYIKSNKPAVAVRYSESERFAKYVYLYSNKHEYFALINSLVDDNLKGLSTKVEANNFLYENTWSHRIKEIVKTIKMEES